jgi:glycosyltransferase involved in cell wall biosynthesis
MKVLLIGEYSRFHNSLKEGLIALGHEVTLVGSGDLFKNYPVDIDISPTWNTTNGLTTFIRKAIYRLTKIDLALTETGYRFWKQRHKMQGYDVVQLINSWSIQTTIAKEKKCISYLEQHNKILFLSACGTDTAWVESLFTDHLPYNLLTPYIKDKELAKDYASVLKYLQPGHQSLYAFVTEKVKAIIPTDMDYFLGLKHQDKVTDLIPTPINLGKLEIPKISTEEPLIVFHGINRMNYLKKGNDVFEKAIQLLEATYAHRVKIITVESLPYADYIKAYDQAHVLLDQVYSHDQGYNALEAMAKGKIVGTGAGPHFMSHYGLTAAVAIDTSPDPELIVAQLEQLILHPEKRIQMAKAAQAFVKAHHDHIDVAKKYVSIWSTFLAKN